jgi:hypothetical protein
MPAEALADEPLHAIARDRAGHRLFRDGQPEPGIFHPIGPRQQQEALMARLARILEDAVELGRLEQPETPREGRARWLRWAWDVDFYQQGASRTRPFARLALMTALPDRVDMRARKPCVRLRFRLLG